MRVLSFIGYPSYTVRNRADWNAYNVTMALKGASFTGFADIKINGKPHRITADNSQPVLELFGRRVSEFAGAVNGGAAIFVLPSSNCTEFGQDAKASRIAAAIRAAGCGIPVATPFRWAEAMPKTAGGDGTRDAAILQRKLLFLPQAGVVEAILVDDVMTTGAHLRAAGRVIRNHGVEPISAICFARTVWERPAKILGAVEERLEL